jgi:3-hydroxy-3-methylglutaryl CoA synthase
LIDKRVLVFSYGSGSIASIYSFTGRKCTNEASPFSLERIQKTSDAINRLNLRQQCQVTDFISALDLRAEQYGKVFNFLYFIYLFKLIFYFYF